MSLLSALIGAFLFTILYQFDLNPTVIAICSGLEIIAIRLVSVKYRINLPKVH